MEHLQTLYIVKPQNLKTFFNLNDHKIYRNNETITCLFLKSFNPELQFKYTAFAIENKLIDLLIELKDFKFVTELVSQFKKLENYD